MPNGLVQMRSYAGRDIVRNSCWSFMGPAYSSSRLPLGEVCCGATAHWLSASHLDRLTAVICGLLGPCTPWTRVFYGELTEIASDSDGVVLRERGGYYLSQTWRYRCSTGTLTKKKKGWTDWRYSWKKTLIQRWILRSEVTHYFLFKGNARVTLQSSHHIGYFVVRQKK